MKVVHVTSSLVRRSAGVREAVLGLALAQRAQGMDVCVLGLDHPDWESEKSEWCSVETRVVPVKGPRTLGFAPEMARALAEIEPSIVHLHGLWMYPGRSVLQWHRATGRPYILSPHGMLSPIALSYGRWKKRAVSRWFQNSVFRSAAAIHVTSKTEKDEVRAYGLLSPICLVPNGVSDLEPVCDGTHSQHTVLSLGRIHKKKALDQLILAWAQLAPHFPDWNLVIAGPSELGESQRLSLLINKLGVERAEIRGPVYGAEKINLMASAGVFALPTQSENFAITVAESLMLGVPVVSSHGAPWAGLEDNRCGRWVPFGAEHMSAALQQLMVLDERERREMGTRGREWMKRDYSWPSVSKRLEKFYIEAIQRAL